MALGDRRWSLVGVAAAAVALVAGALVLLDDASEELETTDDRAHAVAVDGDTLQLPDAEIVPGVEVQPGSALVGTAFPLAEVQLDPPPDGEPVGWQAVLVIDGEPLEVWQRYVDVLGVGEAGDPRAACTVRASRPAPTATGDTILAPDAPPPERFVTEPRLDGENHLRCAAASGPTYLSMAYGGQPCCYLDVPPSELDRAAHLFISVRDDGTELPTPSAGADGLRFNRAQMAEPDPFVLVDPIAVPTGDLVHPIFDLPARSHLPGPGERLDDELDFFLDHTTAGLAPPGARSLVAPALLLECNSGLVAVLAVPLVPDAVVSSFDAAADDDDPAWSTSGTDEDGRPWAYGSLGETGGYDMDLVAVQTGADASTVLITECGD